MFWICEAKKWFVSGIECTMIYYDDSKSTNANFGLFFFKFLVAWNPAIPWSIMTSSQFPIEIVISIVLLMCDPPWGRTLGIAWDTAAVAKLQWETGGCNISESQKLFGGFKYVCSSLAGIVGFFFNGWVYQLSHAHPVTVVDD